MVLYDKAALAEKLGRKVANYIEILLTPESEEEDVRAALEKLMKVDLEKLSLKYGNEPPEILVAAAVGFLRLKGGIADSAGTVAVDNFNEAISLEPELDNDILFRQDFLYKLVKAGADLGDAALQAVLCDLYVGDVVAPGLGAKFESDGMTLDQLRAAINALAEQAGSSNDVKQALDIAGISPDQLLSELDWVPYGDNGFAKARRFAQEGRTLRSEGKDATAAQAFFRSALYGNAESAKAYAALTTDLFKLRDRKAELKANKIFKRTLNKAERAGRSGEPDEKISSLFERSELLEHPGAILTRAELLKKTRSPGEVLELLERAADKGDYTAELTAADYYSKYDNFNFDKMMRFLFEGLVNPGSWYAFGKTRVPFNLLAQDHNEKAYEKLGELLAGLCYERDMIDELEELSEPGAIKTPELTEEQQKAVFMWFLCDPGSDERREVLARFYATGFGTEKDYWRATEIRKELCEKYEAKAADNAAKAELVIETAEPDEETRSRSEAAEESEAAETLPGTAGEETPAAEAEEAADTSDTAEAEGTADTAEEAETAEMGKSEGSGAEVTTESTAEVKTEPGAQTETEPVTNNGTDDENLPGSRDELFNIDSIDDDADEAEYLPFEAFYTYALHLITAEGAERDTERGVKLLKLIPEKSPWSRKASKLLALTETKTSELLRLGAVFHKEGNDGAMCKIYEAAEKLGDPVAARVLGRFYSLPENGADNDAALRHFGIGAARGDIQSMYFAGAACQEAGDYSKAYEFYKNCAENLEKAESEDDKAVCARAMRDNAELYYSGALTGEKNVPKYLYWLDRAENSGFKLSDAAIDKRRAAENYFKPAQWQDIFDESMSDPDEGYREWAAKTCAERKVSAAQEEYGVILYKKYRQSDRSDSSGNAGSAKNGRSAYAQLKTPALSSPRAQYYTACALYVGAGCEPDIDAAERMLPHESEFGDPEQLRHEISGMAAYVKAGELAERKPEEAAELLKKADAEFTAVFEKYGRDNVRFELAELLIRAYGVPDKFSPEELNSLWRRGYEYLLGGYQKDGRCTSQIDAYSAGRICEIARMYDDDNALSWFEIASARDDAAAQYGAGSIYLARAKNEENGKIVDNDSFVKAKELILRAAMQENADAEFAMYAERLLFDVDTDEARLYLKRAAIHGNDQAREVCRELEIAF